MKRSNGAPPELSKTWTKTKTFFLIGKTKKKGKREENRGQGKPLWLGLKIEQGERNACGSKIPGLRKGHVDQDPRFQIKKLQPNEKGKRGRAMGQFRMVRKERKRLECGQQKFGKGGVTSGGG